MKAAAVIIALAGCASATKFLAGPKDWSLSHGIQAKEVSVHEWNRRNGLLKRQTTTVAPAKQPLPNRNPHIPGAKTIKVRYGPYTVPGAKVKGGEGMITNRPYRSVPKPCENCYILGMNAGLEYPDGKDANTDTLMWLHHMVLFNVGKGANDATCSVFGAPHMIVGASPQTSERFFSSGNERTTTFFNPPWANMTNMGYPIYPQDRFGMIIDLMNMNMEAKETYLTIYYDYIEGHPAGIDEIKPVWMDAAQCGTSEVSGRTKGAKFDFASSPWIANFDGEVTGAGGHLHDGGTKVDILVDDKVICTSVPTYGTDEEALVRANAAKTGNIAVGASNVLKRQEGGHSHGTPGGKHIIAMSICADNKAGVKNMPISPLGIKELKKGQSWKLRAYYDYTLHEGMAKGNTEQMSSVMGISIMYAKTKNKRVAA